MSRAPLQPTRMLPQSGALAAGSVGIVTGLIAEARIARSLGPVAIGGGTPEGALDAAEHLVGTGMRGLLSFGIAGGLGSALRPGSLVVPVAVIEDDDHLPTDRQLRDRLGGGALAPLLATYSVVVGAGYKAILHQTSTAESVDLESGAVARVALRHGIPFAVLRAICDPAERTLTPAALVGVTAAGGLAVGRVLRALLRQPGELPGLIALARDVSAARIALVRRVDEIRLRGGLVL